MIKENKNNILLIIILAAVFGLASGIAGSLAARVYFLDRALDIPFLGEIDFSDGAYRGSNLIIRDAKKVVIEQNDKAAETANSVKSSLVGIFKKKLADSAANKAKIFNPADYYLKGEEVGQGLIITSDGWIITGFNITNPADYVVITQDEKVYAVDKAVSDKLTLFNFLHIQAKDLPVRKLASSSDINAGQSTLVVNWDRGMAIVSVADNKKRLPQLVDSSDSYADYVELAVGLGEEYSGAILFNFNGDVLGLFKKDKEVEPISHLNSAINSLLRSGSVKRAGLGVNYIDLSRLVNPLKTKEENGTQNQDSGAVIYKNAAGVAVARGSSAHLAGLKEGDVILSVNNIKIDENNSLDDIIQTFGAGDKVTIIYSRNGENNELTIELGELK